MCFFLLLLFVLQVIQLQTEMAHISSDMCEMQLNGVSDVMDLLHIDVETDVVEDRPGRGDALCSVSLFNNPSY